MAKYLLVVVVAILAYANAVPEVPQFRAITKLTSPDPTKNVSGTVTFTQVPNGKIHVTGTLFGLPAGKYGFHVHEKGDITGGCISAGSHFNPEHKNHGSPDDEDRHVGDLGNVEFKENSEAIIDITDGKIGFFGPNCIIGRAVVLHEKDDDFGKGGHPDSRKTGNAGGRVACGVIGILDPVYGWKTNDASQSTFIAAILIPLSAVLLFMY